MSRPSSNLRLFVAIYPPADLARWLVNRLRKLTLPAHKPAELEQVHLTLQFIGDTPAAEMDQTVESIQRSASGIGSFALQPQRLITLPERGPARLVAAQTDAPPALLELQRRLAVRLADPARRRAHDGFRPHLTLCRFNSPTTMDALDQQLQAEAFAVQRIVLMRSVLAPAGARHQEVTTVQLEDAP